MRTQVKICGITTHCDAQVALEAGADALGFVFSASPRQIAPAQARAIIKQLPPFTTTVGVFVNEPIEKVTEIVRYCGLSAVQFHGTETNEYCQSLQVPVIKGFHIESVLDENKINAYKVAACLLDARVLGQNGGTNQVFDWNLLSNKRLAHPLIVAGGLHAGNVGQLIRKFKPSAVDVSSGVAESIRSKDAGKIRAFMAAVADADASLSLNATPEPEEDILRTSFDRQPLVEINGRKFLLNALTEQVPATPAALLRTAAQRICDLACFPADSKLVGEEDKGGGLLAAVSLLSGLPYGIARWYPSGLEGQICVNFDCEYTDGALYLNGVESGDRIYIVDDLISTGGTLIGLVDAIRRAGATVLGIVCVAEKINYGGTERVLKVTGISVKSLIEVDVSGKSSVVSGVNY